MDAKANASEAELYSIVMAELARLAAQASSNEEKRVYLYLMDYVADDVDYVVNG